MAILDDQGLIGKGAIDEVFIMGEHRCDPSTILRTLLHPVNLMQISILRGRGFNLLNLVVIVIVHSLFT